MHKKQYPLIGIIAVTTPGAAIFAQRFVEEASQHGLGAAHPEYFIHAKSTAEYINLVNSEDWHGVTRLVMDSVTKLSSLGARLFVMPSNTPHYAWQYIELELEEYNHQRKKPIIFLNLIKTTVAECKNKHQNAVLLLGTAQTMNGDLYKRELEENGIKTYVPNQDDIAFLDGYIKNHLVKNELNELYTKRVFEIIDALYAINQFDAIILGCTELPMILGGELFTLPNKKNTSIKLIDTTAILANKVLEKAIEMEE